MDTDCIFCKIGAGTIHSQKVFDDGIGFAIRDVAPRAPTHLLVIPYMHIGSLMDAPDEHRLLAAHCLAVAPILARAEGLISYRLVVNQGMDAGQEIPHFHLHILGGHRMGTMG